MPGVTKYALSHLTHTYITLLLLNVVHMIVTNIHCEHFIILVFDNAYNCDSTSVYMSIL